MFSVDSSPSSGANEVNGVLVLHAQLDEGQGDEDGRPSESCDAVYSYARFGLFLETISDQLQPVLDDFRRRRRAIFELHIVHLEGERKIFIFRNAAAIKDKWNLIISGCVCRPSFELKPLERLTPGRETTLLIDFYEKSIGNSIITDNRLGFGFKIVHDRSMSDKLCDIGMNSSRAALQTRTLMSSFSRSSVWYVGSQTRTTSVTCRFLSSCRHGDEDHGQFSGDHRENLVSRRS